MRYFVIGLLAAMCWDLIKSMIKSFLHTPLEISEDEMREPLE